MSNSTPFYEPGTYMAEIVGQALTKASTGTQQLLLRVKIIGRVNHNDPESLISVAQYERSIYRPITENTIEYFLKDLEQLGYSRDSFRYLDPNQPNHHSFVGQQIEVFCKHEADRDGNMREKWGLAKKQSEFTATPADPADVRKLDMMFGKYLRKSGAPKPTVVPQRTAVAAGAVSDDDIPF